MGLTIGLLHLRQQEKYCVVTESYHMLNPTVLSFSVFPDGNQVYISVGGFIALNRHTGAHVSIQVKGFSQKQVHGGMASSYWCLQRTCKLCHNYL